MPELDSLLDAKIDALIRSQFDSVPEPKVGQVVVQFLDRKKMSKKTGWFGQKSGDDTLKLWESWILNVKCVPVASDTGGSATASAGSNIKTSVDSFEANLNAIVDIVDTHKDHIPPITSLDSSPFPYTVDVDRRVAVDDESWGKYIQRMLD